MKPFRFKQFSIQQDKTAMKVGTDGILLGTWAQINTAQTILDIGTGTGLIALQLAQRSDAETIDAIEIEPHAFEQAVENFEASDWADRLFCYHSSLKEFSNEITDTYDLIISNPPFYNNSIKSVDNKRTLARHTDNLSFATLLKHSSKLLSKKGSCAFIIPYSEEKEFLELALENGLHPLRITRVKGCVSAPIKRSLLQLSFAKTKPEINSLIIEEERHKYTTAYIDLVKDFYLKM